MAGIPATLVGLWLYELKVGLFDLIPPDDPGDNNFILKLETQIKSQSEPYKKEDGRIRPPTAPPAL